MFNYEYYSKHLVEILYVWEGGLAIHGGIIFGGIASIIYCKKYGVSDKTISKWCEYYNLPSKKKIIKSYTDD